MNINLYFSTNQVVTINHIARKKTNIVENKLRTNKVSAWQLSFPRLHKQTHTYTLTLKIHKFTDSSNCAPSRQGKSNRIQLTLIIRFHREEIGSDRRRIVVVAIGNQWSIKLGTEMGVSSTRHHSAIPSLECFLRRLLAWLSLSWFYPSCVNPNPPAWTKLVATWSWDAVSLIRSMVNQAIGRRAIFFFSFKICCSPCFVSAYLPPGVDPRSWCRKDDRGSSSRHGFGDLDLVPVGLRAWFPHRGRVK